MLPDVRRPRMIPQHLELDLGKLYPPEQQHNPQFSPHNICVGLPDHTTHTLSRLPPPNVSVDAISALGESYPCRHKRCNHSIRRIP